MRELKRVFPDRAIVELEPPHPIYSCFYKLEKYPQTPGLGSFLSGRTWEKGGFIPHLRAILDERERPMVLINWNTDMGDGWEWSNAEEYPGYFRYTARSVPDGHQRSDLRADALSAHVGLESGQMATSDVPLASVAEKVGEGRERILSELRKVIVGQDEVVDQILIALFTGGHCLITGVPGLAKTLLVRTLAEILDLSFKRIQFTPDLMPADITGTEILDEDGGVRSLRFVKGPVFAHIILADEINRTPPKTQAALLEAMQEYHVTAAGRTYALEQPFFVLATQNPIELEGTYPLPEAQLDRFMFNLVMTYLSEDEEVRVVTRDDLDGAAAAVSACWPAPDILQFQQIVREVLVAEDVARYAVRLVDASRPGRATAKNRLEFIDKWVKWGAGLRASQALILGGKARALMHGRYHVSVADIQALAPPILRHRVITNFYAESEQVTSDGVVTRLIESVPPPKSGLGV